MEQSKEEILLKKYLAGNATAEESAIVESWYLSEEEKGTVPSAEQLTYAETKVWNALSLNAQPRKVKLWPRIAAAASIVIAIGAGLWFYTTRHPAATLSSRVSRDLNDVPPGKNAATLTLANGKKIFINDAASGQLAEQHGVKISKTADGQIVYELKDKGNAQAYNTLQTSNGEQTKVRLQDGSVIALNAASSLTYPASFAGLKERRVKLKGEGYFAVHHDAKQPFRVETKGQVVEDIGTEFNVNAYDDEAAVKTTLVEGIAKVYKVAALANSYRHPANTPRHPEFISGPRNSKAVMQGVGGDAVTLTPNQQSILTANNQLTVQQVDVTSVIDWKNNEFYLDKMEFKLAMRKIARWYNVEVIYSGSVPDNLKAGGWIPRNSNLSDVLKAIEATGLAHFKIEGRKLYVSK